MKQFVFIAGECTPVGFTDGKVYEAWQRAGYEDMPLRTWHTLNDNGHERVFIPNETNAHCVPSAWNGFFTEKKYCTFVETTS